MSRPLLRTAALAAAAVLLTACGTGSTAEPKGAAGDPVTVTNCGAEVRFPAPPQRAVLLKSDAVPFLSELDVLDRVVARAGEYPDGYYDERTRAALDQIPALTGKLDSSGHLQISKEVVVAQEPDVVLGEVPNLGRSAFAAVDVPLLEQPAMCTDGITEPGFGEVWTQLELYGKVFDRSAQAAAAVERLQQRVEEVRARTGQQERTAAVLYPTVGGGVTYAYGSRSMATPQLEAAGLRNVFSDVDERVFETSVESLLERDPDVLVLLHNAGDPDKVVEAVTSLPGADRLTAVREDAVLPQLFNFTEPPTPLSVTGLERLQAWLEQR